MSSLTEQPLEFVDLTDFSPGITSNVLPAGTAPLGAARIEDTWGCVALPNGGLGPAPRFALYFDQNITYEYGGSNIAIPDDIEDKDVARIHDLVVHQETFYEPYVTDDNGQVTNPADTVIVAAERLVYKTGPAATYSSWFAVLSTRNKISQQTYLASERVTFPVAGGLSHNFGSGDIILARGSIDEAGAYDVTFPPHLYVVIHAVFLDGNIDGGQWVDTSIIYPDPGDIPAGYSSTTVNPIDYQVGRQGSIRACYHQGRLVFSVPTAQAQIAGSQPYRDQIRHISEGDDTLSDEQLGYLNVYDLRTDEVGLVQIVDSGKPDMIGCLHSVNTNELYIIKAQGGGVIVRDAMERPTVARYPGVESTGYYPHKPTVVPQLGLVYGTRNGVFAWSGGNQSKSLSPTLHGKFWLTPWNEDRSSTDDLGNHYFTRHSFTGCGRFTYLYPYVYAPNNWVMDVRNGGWFRLYPTKEQDADIGLDLAYFDAASSGLVYATRDHQPQSDDLLYVGFNPSLGASDWSWHSQPIATSNHSRVVQYREVQVVMSGSGTVNVTLIGADGTTQTKRFDVAQDRPLLIRREYKIDTYDLEIKMVAEGSDNDTPAPVVHRVMLGHHSTKRANRGGLTGAS